MTYHEKCALIEKAYGSLTRGEEVALFELVDAAFAVGVAETKQDIVETAKYIPDVINGGGHYLVNEARLWRAR